MISTAEFCAALDGAGIGLVAGVPCSGMSGPIAWLTARGRYVAAANEGAALAMAAGAAATGGRAAVISQNSGFGNLVNPLTSLVMPYRAGVVVFLSMRGWPDPAADEPQHEVMGRCTAPLLAALGIASWELRAASDAGQLAAALRGAAAETDAGRPAFLLIARGVVGAGEAAGPGDAAQCPAAGTAGLLDRAEVIAAMLPVLAGVPVVATTGYTSRDLFAAGDAPGHFYMQGSMGHAAAFALGLVRRPGAAPDSRVVVLDGDGALLMHLGTASTIGAQAPPGLVHVVFDNGCYESTGGQPSTSGSADFAAIALACGYRSACTLSSAGQAAELLAARLSSAGPHLIVVPAARATGPAPPRATSALAPEGIYQRFGKAASELAGRHD